MVILIRLHSVYMYDYVVVPWIELKKDSIVPRANLAGHPGKQTTCISFPSITNVRWLLNRILARPS